GGGGLRLAAALQQPVPQARGRVPQHVAGPAAQGAAPAAGAPLGRVAPKGLAVQQEAASETTRRPSSRPGAPSSASGTPASPGGPSAAGARQRGRARPPSPRPPR